MGWDGMVWGWDRGEKDQERWGGDRWDGRDGEVCFQRDPTTILKAESEWQLPLKIFKKNSMSLKKEEKNYT